MTYTLEDIKSLEDMKRSVCMAVELEDGDVKYLGEFDMTDWNKGWDQAWEKATDISEENDCDPEMMRLDTLDNMLQSATNIYHMHNKINKEDGSGWFTFEVCMDRDDALEIKRLLDKHTDLMLLKDLLDNYQMWDKL